MKGEELERSLDIYIEAPESIYHKKESFHLDGTTSLAIRQRASDKLSCFDSLFQ